MNGRSPDATGPRRNRWGLTEAQVFVVARAAATEVWHFRVSHRRCDVNPRMARALAKQGLVRRTNEDDFRSPPVYEFTPEGRSVARDLLPHVPL